MLHYDTQGQWTRLTWMVCRSCNCRVFVRRRRSLGRVSGRLLLGLLVVLGGIFGE